MGKQIDILDGLGKREWNKCIVFSHETTTLFLYEFMEREPYAIHVTVCCSSAWYYL